MRDQLGWMVRLPAGQVRGVTAALYCQTIVRYREHHRLITCRASSMSVDTSSSPPTAAIVWFRNDLRLADHAPLHAALSSRPAVLLPLYCLDKRDLQPRQLLGDDDGASILDSSSLPQPSLSPSPDEGLGIPKLGPYRLRSLLEALATLDAELQACGSRLAFHQGSPEVVLGRAVALFVGKGSHGPGPPPALDSQAHEAHEAPGTQQPAQGSPDGSSHPRHLAPKGSGQAQAQAQAQAQSQAQAQVRSLSPGPPLDCSGSQAQQTGPCFGALELHYHMEPGGEAAAVEAAVEEAVQAAAAAGGMRCCIHRHWGATLYHPDDLPYHLFGTGTPRHGAAQQAQHETQRHTQHEVQREEGSVGREVVHPRRFECLPGVMTPFRKAVQAHTRVRTPLPKPTSLPPFPSTAEAQGLLGGPLPTDLEAVYVAAGAAAGLRRLESLAGFSVQSIPPPGTGPADPHSAFPFPVGEQQAVQRLRYYLGLDPSDRVKCRGPQDPHPMLHYQDTRMLAFGVDNSAKLSPFLALGCVSPRTVYWEALRALEQEAAAKAGAAAQHADVAGSTDSPPQQVEQQAEAGAAPQEPEQSQQAWQEPVSGDSVRWLLMHLGIRDFFLYTLLKDGGDGVLRPGGIKGRPASWRAGMAAFERWARGQTGLPFVDACMREIAGSGFMSNRGRQNAASFLAKGLCLDWRLGAQLFESLLADHDFSLNWVNWAYVAGTGNDPRNRIFKTVSQGEAYDPEARLIKAWVGELADLPAELAHRPWEAQAQGAGAMPGDDVAAGAGAILGGGPEEQAQQPTSAAVVERGQGREEGSGQAAGLQVGEAASGVRGARDGTSYPQPMVDPQTQIRKERSRQT